MSDVEAPLLAGGSVAVDDQAAPPPDAPDGPAHDSFAAWAPDQQQEDLVIEPAVPPDLSSKAGGVANLIVSAVGGAPNLSRWRGQGGSALGLTAFAPSSPTPLQPACWHFQRLLQRRAYLQDVCVRPPGSPFGCTAARAAATPSTHRSPPCLLQLLFLFACLLTYFSAAIVIR